MQMTKRPVGRPRKQVSGRAPQVRSRYFRLVIPDLRDHLDPADLLRLKGDTLRLLLDRQGQSLQYYKVAAQTHPTTGIPHLDILLLYRRSVKKSLNRFDYLVKHGHLTRYRKLNQAILQYGDKQDQAPLTNLPLNSSLVLRAKEVQTDLYSVLEQEMLRDPFYFQPYAWIQANRLGSAVSRTNWSKAVSLVKKLQQARCNLLLQQKPGFRYISRALIQQNLTPDELTLFDSWTGYQTIVDKLNQVVTHGCHRPHKAPHLLLVGPPNTGKTALALRVRRLASVYFMGVSNWFPRYRSDVYRMILWNEFNLRLMPYPNLLNLLEGTPMDLQYKGGSTLRTDNQLVLMTSNMTLDQHVDGRFRTEQSRTLARANLRARVNQVIVPPGLDLFLLQKLIVAL